MLIHFVLSDRYENIMLTKVYKERERAKQWSLFCKMNKYYVLNTYIWVLICHSIFVTLQAKTES